MPKLTPQERSILQNILPKDIFPLEKIAEGGIAEIWSAITKQIHKPFALKIAHDSIHLNPYVHQQFLRELRCSQLIAHDSVPHIIKYDTDEDNRPYLYMDLLEASPLSTYTNWNWIELKPVLINILIALKHIHQSAIIHRDLKPNNILIAENNDVFIIDFGLAYFLNDPTPPEPTPAYGTPAYMSPEQAQGLASKLSPASDLYALGIILYEILSNTKPFEHLSPVEIMHQQAFSKLPDLPTPLQNFPKELINFTNKLLRKTTDSIPLSADLLLTEIQSI